MASKSQICEFLHQDLNFGAFFIVLNIYFIFFITISCMTMWYSGKHSCLESRRPGFKSHYCQKSFFSFKSWRRNSKICDQDAISIWLPLNSCVDASLNKGCVISKDFLIYQNVFKVNFSMIYQLPSSLIAINITFPKTFLPFSKTFLT